jgi:dihydroxyacetone synthase
MRFAVNTKNILSERFNIVARIVSFPCQRLFEAQTAEYKRQVLKHHSKVPIVVVEAYAVNGWEQYADAGVSMSTFGHSLPRKLAYKHFGFDEELIVTKVAEFVVDVRENGIEKPEERVQGLDNSSPLGACQRTKCLDREGIV